MAVDKYDIPYAMKPKGKGKDKNKDKSKYTAYIKTQKKGFFNSLSPDARKLLIYVFFFSIFAYVFLTTLRSSQVPEATDYELDLDYSNSRERNLIDDSLDKDKTTYNEQVEDAIEEVEVEVIDSLASDEDEISGELERKTIKKAKEGGNKQSDFESQLDEMLEESNKQLKGKKKDSLPEKNDKIKHIPKEEIKRQPKKGKKY